MFCFMNITQLKQILRCILKGDIFNIFFSHARFFFFGKSMILSSCNSALHRFVIITFLPLEASSRKRWGGWKRQIEALLQDIPHNIQLSKSYHMLLLCSGNLYPYYVLLVYHIGCSNSGLLPVILLLQFFCLKNVWDRLNQETFSHHGV